MKAPCTITQQPNGTWLVRHTSSFLGTVEIFAPARDEARRKNATNCSIAASIVLAPAHPRTLWYFRLLARAVMNEAFEKKVRAAAVAGWWVVLIAVGFLTLQWLIYLAILSTTRRGCLPCGGQVSIGSSSRTCGFGSWRH